MRSDFIVRSVLVALPALGLLSGFAVPLFGLPAWQRWVWAAFTVPVLLALLYEILSSLRLAWVRLQVDHLIKVAAQAGIKTHTTVFPLREADEVLSKLRSRQITDAAVLQS